MGGWLQTKRRLQNGDWLERLKAVRRYAREAGETAVFPQPPPEVPSYPGRMLEDWADPLEREPILT